MADDVKVTGPVFDGTAKRAAQDFATDASKTIAEAAVNEVRLRFRRVLQNPTGYLSSRVTTERVSTGYAVTNGNVVYGPWIEGEGSRNRTSRFKGYHTFRLVRQEMARFIGPLADRTFQRYLGRMQ